MRLTRLLTVSTLALAAVVTPAATAATATGTLTLTAQGPNGRTVSGNEQFVVGGDTNVSLRSASVSGGSMKLVEGPQSGLPTAVRFPRYVGSGTYPRAVMGMTPTSGSALSPGTSDFTFGGVFSLDTVSSGRSEDNGDNLLQRGLYNQSSQFKLDLDKGRPACSVRGAAGRVIVRAGTAIQRDTWYTASCTRTGSMLTLKVARYGSSTTQSTSRYGATGSLSFPSSRPASIGGKLTASGGVLASATDQFNGSVAQIWVRRLP